MVFGFLGFFLVIHMGMYQKYLSLPVRSQGAAVARADSNHPGLEVEDFILGRHPWDPVIQRGRDGEREDETFTKLNRRSKQSLRSMSRHLLEERESVRVTSRTSGALAGNQCWGACRQGDIFHSHSDHVFSNQSDIFSYQSNIVCNQGDQSNDQSGLDGQSYLCFDEIFCSNQSDIFSNTLSDSNQFSSHQSDVFGKESDNCFSTKSNIFINLSEASSSSQIESDQFSSHQSDVFSNNCFITESNIFSNQSDIFSSNQVKVDQFSSHQSDFFFINQSDIPPSLDSGICDSEQSDIFSV